MVDNNSDDPFALPEGTIIRPRPGAGRRTSVQPAFRPAVPGAPPPGFAPAPPSGSDFAGTSTAAPGPGWAPGAESGSSLADFVGGTDNPILQAAAPLLLLVTRLGAVQQVGGAMTLRQQAVHEVRACEDRLRTAAVSREDILVARYVLCTFVDTAVLNTRSEERRVGKEC